MVLTNLFKKFCTGLYNFVHFGWIVESINSRYINISTYRLLIGSSYVKLSAELRSPKKGLINIKNSDQKCFLWCHIRYINPVKTYSEKITQKDKELVNALDYEDVKFPVSEDKFNKIETKSKFASMFLVMKIN